jgi:hypothetical protein
VREEHIVSQELRLKARVLPTTGEVCWARDEIEAAFRELANAGQVILGFDIMEMLPGSTVCIHGTSAGPTLKSVSGVLSNGLTVSLAPY